MPGAEFDATVVGGGPAGARTAGLIAKAGFSVAIIEEHAKVGEPVQCAGLVSPRCIDIARGSDSAVINRLTGARIFPPSARPIEIGGGRVQAVVIDRAAFDRGLMERAVDSGAYAITGARVREVIPCKGYCTVWADRALRARLVVGADGAKSLVRRSLGLEEPAHMMLGITADVIGADIEQDMAQVFFGRDIAPNFFAWMIPAGDIARVGLCVRGTDKAPNQYFRRLFRQGPSAGMLRGARILGMHSGLIPFAMLPRTWGDWGMVVGDAACQVKATSGGGIYPGLVCAGHCAAAAVTALQDGRAANSLSGYHAAWTGEIGGELAKALAMHRAFSSLDDRELDDIFGMLAEPGVLDVINRIGDIDFPSKLAWMLLKKEPGFLKYAGKYLMHGFLNL